MNYWPVDTANLSECIEPLARMVGELAVSGARAAQQMYGARGWVAHHNTDLWRASGPVDHARTGLWPTGGAWLACQLWDHWDFHRDRAWLERIYPLLRGAALFFLDTLVRDPDTGFMVTNPSLSPENEHRSEEHTYELQSLMRISYAVLCLQKKNKTINKKYTNKINTTTKANITEHKT